MFPSSSRYSGSSRKDQDAACMEVEASARREARPAAPLSPEPPGERTAGVLPSATHCTAGASAGLGIPWTPQGPRGQGTHFRGVARAGHGCARTPWRWPQRTATRHEPRAARAGGTDACSTARRRITVRGDVVTLADQRPEVTPSRDLCFLNLASLFATRSREHVTQTGRGSGIHKPTCPHRPHHGPHPLLRTALSREPLLQRENGGSERSSHFLTSHSNKGPSLAMGFIGLLALGEGLDHWGGSQRAQPCCPGFCGHELTALWGRRWRACRCLSVRWDRSPTWAVPPALTCGIAGTPDCSHLSCWSLLPDHRAEVVLVTDLMGLCREARGSAWGRVWEGGPGAGSRRGKAKTLPEHPLSPGRAVPSKLSPKPAQLLGSSSLEPSVGWEAGHSPGHRWAPHGRCSS